MAAARFRIHVEEGRDGRKVIEALHQAARLLSRK